MPGPKKCADKPSIIETFLVTDRAHYYLTNWQSSSYCSCIAYRLLYHQPHSPARKTEFWNHRTREESVASHYLSSVQFIHSVVSDSLRPHELQHTRPPCPSPAPGVHPNPCPLSQWCHPAISYCLPLLLPPSIFPRIRVFSNDSTLRIRWPKYWSFSFNISPSSEHPGPSSLRMDWLISLQSKRLSRVFSTTAVQSINSLVLSFIYSPILTPIPDYWKNHSFE